MTATVPASWVAPIDAWEMWLRAADRPPTTRYLRTYQMRRFAAETGGHPWDVTTDQMLAWLGAQVWATETRRSYRAALCSFYRWAHISGRMASNPAALLPPIKPPVRLPRPTPEGVLAAALLAATPRVQLMVLLAAREGLRRSEIAQVHSRDLEHDLTGWSLHVHGKGSKDRLVPLSEQVWTLLSGAPAGFLFPGAIDGHLSPAYVGKLVSRVLGVGWSAHTLRHRFATVAYAGERDLLAVQMLLGHSKPETTRLYVLIPNASLRAAVAWAA